MMILSVLPRALYAWCMPLVECPSLYAPRCMPLDVCPSLYALGGRREALSGWPEEPAAKWDVRRMSFAVTRLSLTPRNLPPHRPTGCYVLAGHLASPRHYHPLLGYRNHLAYSSRFFCKAYQPEPTGANRGQLEPDSNYEFSDYF